MRTDTASIRGGCSVLKEKNGWESFMRIKEAKMLGFKKCILSKSNQQACRALKGIDPVGIDSVKSLMEMLF